MKGNVNLHKNTAFLYDYDNRQILKDDVSFCLGYLEKTRGDILEIACGTGRMTIPILERIAGSERNILALDLSESMTDVLKSKLTQADFGNNKSLINNLQIEIADMSNFSFKRKFGLILLMWRSFQCLTNLEEARGCLKCIHDHMSDDAVLLLNIFLPGKTYGAEWLGKEIISFEAVDEKTGAKIVRSTKNVASDETNQIIQYLTRYDVTFRNGETEHCEDTIVLKYYYPEQIKEMFRAETAKFEIVEELYSLNPLNKERTDQYYVLRKA